jgi:ubiquinone/menaquinone biosynthesis C-methylase UbiE
MIPVAAINEASRQCLDRGIRILQGYRLADTDLAHIETLLGYMQPAPNTQWVDIGCGFGEPAALMLQLRPDLQFDLVNNNDFQLSQVPLHLTRWRADMHALPFAARTFDGAMFLYSLCHAGGLLDALKEAARVVRPGGRLFVYDCMRKFGSNLLTWQHLGANFFEREVLRYSTDASGWKMNRLILPPGDDAVFRGTFGDKALYEELFTDLVPVIWTATRQ